MKDEVLPEFQKHLRSKSPVQEKYIPFYAYRARKMLSGKLLTISIKPSKNRDADFLPD